MKTKFAAVFAVVGVLFACGDQSLGADAGTGDAGQCTCQQGEQGPAGKDGTNGTPGALTGKGSLYNVTVTSNIAPNTTFTQPYPVYTAACKTTKDILLMGTATWNDANGNHDLVLGGPTIGVDLTDTGTVASWSTMPTQLGGSLGTASTVTTTVTCIGVL